MFVILFVFSFQKPRLISSRMQFCFRDLWGRTWIRSNNILMRMCGMLCSWPTWAVWCLLCLTSCTTTVVREEKTSGVSLHHCKGLQWCLQLSERLHFLVFLKDIMSLFIPLTQDLWAQCLSCPVLIDVYTYFHRRTILLIPQSWKFCIITAVK